MTPAELSAILARLGLTQAGAASVLGVSPRAMRMWIAGDRAIPRPVGKLLRLIDAGALTPDAVRDA